MKAMLLLNVQLRYAHNSQLALLYSEKDDTLVLAALSGGDVADAYYRWILDNDESTGELSLKDAIDFRLVMDQYFQAITQNAQPSRRCVAISLAVLTNLDVRLDNRGRLPRLLKGCDIYLARRDWEGDGYSWKDSVASVEPMLV